MHLTASAMSPCPVIITTGQSTFAALSSLRTATPSMHGILMSSIIGPGDRATTAFKNAAPEENERAANPFDCSKLVKERAKSQSSSTTYTANEVASAIGNEIFGQWQRKGEDSSLWSVMCRYASRVSLNDLLAD